MQILAQHIFTPTAITRVVNRKTLPRLWSTFNRKSALYVAAADAIMLRSTTARHLVRTLLRNTGIYRRPSISMNEPPPLGDLQTATETTITFPAVRTATYSSLAVLQLQCHQQSSRSYRASGVRAQKYGLHYCRLIHTTAVVAVATKRLRVRQQCQFPPPVWSARSGNKPPQLVGFRYMPTAAVMLVP